MQRRIISVTTLNEHGVLSRIAGLFAGRGYNIESLTVAPIPQTKYSHFTIQTNGDERVLEQIIKQLHKLIPVLKVTEHGGENYIEKEMALVKIPIKENISDIDVLSRSYDGKIANVTSSHIIVVVHDEPSRIKNFLGAINKYNPKEIARSGVVAIER